MSNFVGDVRLGLLGSTCDAHKLTVLFVYVTVHVSAAFYSPPSPKVVPERSMEVPVGAHSPCITTL